LRALALQLGRGEAEKFQHRGDSGSVVDLEVFHCLVRLQTEPPLDIYYTRQALRRHSLNGNLEDVKQLRQKL